jgi:hypothetical protein
MRPKILEIGSWLLGERSCCERNAEDKIANAKLFESHFVILINCIGTSVSALFRWRIGFRVPRLLKSAQAEPRQAALSTTPHEMTPRFRH